MRQLPADFTEQIHDCRNDLHRNSPIQRARTAVFNPRPVAFWRATHSIGGWGWGGGRIVPLKSPKLLASAQNLTPFDSPVHESFEQGIQFDLEANDDVTGRFKSKCSTVRT